MIVMIIEHTVFKGENSFMTKYQSSSRECSCPSVHDIVVSPVLYTGSLTHVCFLKDQRQPSFYLSPILFPNATPYITARSNQPSASTNSSILFVSVSCLLSVFTSGKSFFKSSWKSISEASFRGGDVLVDRSVCSRSFCCWLSFSICVAFRSAGIKGCWRVWSWCCPKSMRSTWGAGCLGCGAATWFA